MNILISACLLGINCRYDGGGCCREEIVALKKKHHLIPICPEILGGLSTPRLPIEIIKGKCVNERGADKTEAFVKGAEEASKIAKLLDVELAILKSNSPSCGYGKVYDGTFSRKLTNGNGITAERLSAQGIQICNEHNFMEVLE